MYLCFKHGNRNKAKKSRPVAKLTTTTKKIFHILRSLGIPKSFKITSKSLSVGHFFLVESIFIWKL